MTLEIGTGVAFRKYDHVERLDHEDVDGLLLGKVHVFPKLDGTNGALWVDGDGLHTGSRNREVTVDDDNQGFAAHAHALDRVPQYGAIPWGWIVYGEWMVPHTLKTYRTEAWRRFWVFDVFCIATQQYLPFETYSPVLKALGLDLIRPIAIIHNPSREQLQNLVETNTFLIQDGAGVGEGLVFKNYEWKNRYGRQPWAKLVRNEFKEQNRLAMGVRETDGPFQVELAIAQEFCSPEFVAKTRAKVVVETANGLGIDLAADPNAQATVEATHRHKVIPQLLGRAFHDLVHEELWAALKRHKNPAIDFKKLQQCVTLTVKNYAKDLFS